MTFVENISSSVAWSLYHDIWARGCTRMARGGIRLVHGLTKSTLITYYSGMKKDPKYAFLPAFFLICLSCSFQNVSIWPKTHPFFPNFARFCNPKRYTCVQCLVLKNNPNYVNFWTSLIPPWHSSGPPGICDNIPNTRLWNNMKAAAICQKSYYKIRVKATICVSRMKLHTHLLNFNNLCALSK